MISEIFTDRNQLTSSIKSCQDNPIMNEFMALSLIPNFSPEIVSGNPISLHSTTQISELELASLTTFVLYVC